MGENRSNEGSRASMMSAWLAGVALTSPDVHRLSQFYVDVLGYDGQQTGATWRGALCARWLEIHEGSANALDHAVFAVAGDADLSGLRGRLGSAGVAIEEIEAAGMSGSIKFSDPDGNKLIFGVATSSAADAPGESVAARLQHIVYASDEVTTQLRFYCDIVGFAPSDFVSDENSNLTAVFLRCSEDHHSLAIFRASRKRLDHFCYEVGDWGHIRDWADRFAARRMKLSWGPGRHGPGNNLFLFVNDPDGNWLEFSAELERVKGARPVKHWLHEERTLNSWGTAHMRS
jgi:catechol 2,3-dioxygenase-like lactoylglutathione lyase family enzyme